MKKLAFVLCSATALISAPALAADLRMPVKAPPVAFAPVGMNWSGFYIGGFVGGAFADGDAVSSEPCSATACYNTTLAAAVDNRYRLRSSFIGGGTVGFNWQAPGSVWVFGLEGEGGYLSLRRTVLDVNAPVVGGVQALNGFDTTRIGDAYGVLAGRIGVAFDRVLLYGKGGVAFVSKHYDFTDTCTVAPCGPATLSLGRNTTQVTWAAGAGLEYAFTPNWSLKGEYLYLATRESFSVSGAVVGGPAAGTIVTVNHTDPGVHTAKIGLNYRFGGGPVVASY